MVKNSAWRARATRTAAIVALGVTAGWTGPAAADPVTGQLELPRELTSPRRYPGYWRVENGTLPAREDSAPVIVWLVGAAGSPPAAKTYSVKLEGFTPDKPVLVVGPGSVLEISNSDRVAHDLSIPGQESLMPLERLAAGGVRRQKFPAPGIFEIRSATFPSTVVTVVVADHPHVAVAESSGAFKLGDVPRGKATLKVWCKGRFVHEEPIEIPAPAKGLRIVVAAAGAAAE